MATQAASSTWFRVKGNDMDAPLTDEQVTRLYEDVLADPTRKDFLGPFFYRALLENLIAARQANVELSRQVRLLAGIQN
jgi:hypothetical protein